MGVKRKGFIWTAFAFAIANLVVGLVVFSYALFDLLDVRRKIGVPVIRTLRLYLTQIIGLAVALVLLSIFTLWAVSTARKKNKLTAALVLVLHLSLCIAGLCFTSALYNLYNLPPLTPLVLLSHAQVDMAKMHETSKETKAVPPWLDDIQRKSKECCGIVNFRDWDIFWAPLKRQVPESCCLADRKECVTNFKKLVYPDLVSHNIKMEDGCHAEVNAKVKWIVGEVKSFTLLLTLIVAVSLIAFIALYVVVFYLKKSPDEDDYEDDLPPAAGDPPTGSPPKFLKDDTLWPTLEFFSSKTSKPFRKLRRNKVPVQVPVNSGFNGSNGGSMTGSIDLTGNNSMDNANNQPFQQPYEPQQSQAQIQGPNDTQAGPSVQQSQGTLSPPPPQVQYKIDYAEKDKVIASQSNKVQFIPEVEDYNNSEERGLSAVPSPTEQAMITGIDSEADIEMPRRHRHIHVRGFMKKSRRRHT